MLVCDDDPAARFVAKRWLTTVLGCTVVESEDGVEALEALARQHFDLALIDLDLPRMSGVEVVEAIRSHEDTKRLPIVILSQERREDIIRTLLALGVAAYLLKPLREQAVLGRIGPLLALAAPSRPGRAGDAPVAKLGPKVPALLVDGDQNFRHVFMSVATQFGTVTAAVSGADGLAVYRSIQVPVVFVGEGLGIVSAARLVGKLREGHGRAPRVIRLGAPESASEPGLFDDHMPRLFVPEELTRELRRFVHVPGGLAAIEDLAPGCRECLTTAVVQVFGMMGGVGVQPLAGPAPPPAGPAVEASVDVTLDGDHRMAITLTLPRSLAEIVSALLVGCDPVAIDDDACLSAVGELANMTVGRLDAFLKELGVAVACGLPVPHLVTRSSGEDGPSRGDAVFQRFSIAELGESFGLFIVAGQPR